MLKSALDIVIHAYLSGQCVSRPYVLIRVQRELMSGVPRRFPEAWPWRYCPGVLIGLRSVSTFRGKRGVPAYVPLGRRSSIITFQR